MATKTSLLEELSIQMRCEYLSDLRFINEDQRAYLAEKLEKLQPDTVDLKDWNDALLYLTKDESPQTDAAEAKAALIAGLTASDPNSTVKA